MWNDFLWSISLIEEKFFVKESVIDRKLYSCNLIRNKDLVQGIWFVVEIHFFSIICESSLNLAMARKWNSEPPSRPQKHLIK